MKNLAVVIGALAVFGLNASASAQSLFERCKKQKEEIAGMKNEVGDLSSQIQTIDERLADMARRVRELRVDKGKKTRQKDALGKKIRGEEARHKRRCRALRQCESLDNRVSQLKENMAPQTERLRKIREEIRTRNSGITDLNRDVQRMENQFDQLGCENLQIGQTAQTTFDRCSKLSKDWSSVQNRINQLQASVQRLRKAYQQVMRKMRTASVELDRLLKKMREACSHSARLAELEDMEKRQHEYRSIKDQLDEMDTKVKRFRTLKLKKAKPTIRPKKGDKRKKKKKKHTLKPVR